VRPSRAILGVGAVGLVALAFAGCGGGDDGSSTPAGEAIARANATCRDFERKIRGLGEGVLSGPDVNTQITEQVVKPSIGILRDVARRQQALIPVLDDPDFEVYASLFDPIMFLARERLRSGRAEDTDRSRALEKQMLALGVEQIRAARAADLLDCDKDFAFILQNSLSG
jgi:hypothetical protein